MLRTIGFARVSSREQALEGNSLDVQVSSFERYTSLKGEELVEVFRVAESAKRSEARKEFDKALRFASDPKNRISKILFSAVDRATRNLSDLARLAELKDRHNVVSVAIREGVDNSTSDSELVLTVLAAAARHVIRTSAEKIKASIDNRVIEQGLPPGRAAWGLKNVRGEDMRGRVVPHVARGSQVTRIFTLVADENIPVFPDLADRLVQEGIYFSEKSPRFTRSKLYALLRDRTYVGEVKYQGKWWPGKIQPLVDRALFDRVQERLRRKGQRTKRNLLFSGVLIRCGHCGSAITGEFKKGKYAYYRCANANKQADHPRVRLTEADLDVQVREMLESLRVSNGEVREWFVRVLRSRSRKTQVEAENRRTQIMRELTKTQRKKDELVRIRLSEEIEHETFTRNHEALLVQERELRATLDREAALQTEDGEQAVQVFELAQDLTARWVAAEVPTKRLLLDILCLNLVLEDQTLVPTLRRPFDLLAAGILLPKEEDGRGERI
jgi:site-specific DNA recombinase